MENFPKTYIGRYPTAASLTAGRTRVMSLARNVAPTNNWAFIEETNTIWAQNKNGEWIDTGKAFIRTETFKGNPLIADGTVNWEMQGLKVFGKSKQASTTGAQLIPFELGKELDWDGASLIPTKDSFLVNRKNANASGTIHDVYFVGTYTDYFEYKNLPAGSYYIYCSSDSIVAYVITKRNGISTILGNSISGRNALFSVQSGDILRIFFRDQYRESAPIEETFYAIIRKAKNGPNYEPYTGGMPSPNPEYPQEIESTGDDGSVDLTIAGANLANINSPGSYGDSPMSYIPYQSQLFPIPTPNGLPGIPVDSGGNYTDETGQQWICDYVDFARGVKVQNIGTTDSSGTKIYAESATDIQVSIFKNPVLNTINTRNGFSNKFTCENRRLPGTFTPTNQVLYARFKTETTQDDINEYLKDAIFFYILSTPIETPLSPEELAAYQALTSYDGATNIFSDEEAGLEAELVTDKIDKEGYANPSAELSLYYAALAGFVSLSDVPMPSCRESELVRKLIDPEFEVKFSLTEQSSRNEKYLWDLINGTTLMLSNIPKSKTEKFLHIMLGGEVDEYPTVSSELDYWMDVCATFYGKM